MYSPVVLASITRPLTPRSLCAFWRPTYARWLNPRSFRPPTSVTSPTLNSFAACVVVSPVVVEPPPPPPLPPQPASSSAAAATAPIQCPLMRRLMGFLRCFRLSVENYARLYHPCRARRDLAGSRRSPADAPLEAGAQAVQGRVGARRRRPGDGRDAR